jgi:hypothetical protein
MNNYDCSPSSRFTFFDLDVTADFPQKVPSIRTTDISLRANIRYAALETSALPFIDGYDALSITKAALRLAAVSPTSACRMMCAVVHARDAHPQHLI